LALWLFLFFIRQLREQGSVRILELAGPIDLQDWPGKLRVDALFTVRAVHRVEGLVTAVVEAPTFSLDALPASATGELHNHDVR
jgi:hypothetical protein